MPSSDASRLSAPPTRLKLTMPSPDRVPPHLRESEIWRRPTRDHADHHHHHHSTTPPRPSYSPVTPTSHGNHGLLTHTPAAREQPTEWMDEPPPPVPLSLEDNPDAIALRATLGILQLQREQSLRDIKQLDRIKSAALDHPQAFLDHLKAGKMTKPPPTGLLSLDDDDDDDSHEAEHASTEPNPPSLHPSRFGTFPHAQNVVRAPPINWAKYRIVGESLDKLHQEQRKRPSRGSLRDDEIERPPDHFIAAPYRAFVDKIEHPPLTRPDLDRT